MAAMPLRHDPGHLLAAFASRSTPAVTWYSADERTELSGAVLARWVAKTANFLVFDAGFAPDDTLFVDLPPTWRAFVWAHATWLAGGAVTFREIDDPDVILTDRPDAWAEATGDVLALALPALAMSYDGELPPMVSDANAEVMSAADQLGAMPPLDPTAIALAGPNLRYADLDELLDGGSAQRLMIRPATNHELVRQLASQLLAGGSIVAIDRDFAGDCAAVATQEQALPLRDPCR